MLCLLIAGQLSSKTMTLCLVLFNDDFDFIELCMSEESESEKEENTEEEEQKVQLQFYYSDLVTDSYRILMLKRHHFESINYSEIFFPPPEQS